MSPESNHSRRDFLWFTAKGMTLVLLAGCSRSIRPEQYYYLPEPSGPATQDKKSSRQGKATPNCSLPNSITHEVAPMENVSRLAQTYGVSEEEICRANSLKAGETLQEGRKLVIPHPTRCMNIIPVFKNDRWQYILVHHTAGEVGKAILMDRIHRERGFDQGIGYHFLIDNGSIGKGDGQIEVAPRWLAQQEGAHCKAGNMNPQSIGIGLVGNFNRETPSGAQINSLTQITKSLCDYYRIPVSNVLAHREVPGAKTDCPGKLFPMEGFRLSLKKALDSPVA